MGYKHYTNRIKSKSRSGQIGLGYDTDMMFAEEVKVTSDCVVVRTPSNPGYYWGNFIIVYEPPSSPRVVDLHTKHFPKANHYSIAWRQDEKPGTWWRAYGATLEKHNVMSARPHKTKSDSGTLRFVVNAPWPLVEYLNIFADAEEQQGGDYGLFKRRLRNRYRQLIDEDKGAWLGLADDKGRLVAQGGLFWRGSVGRFQSVETHPAYRRRGLCALLMTCALGFAKKRALTQLILAAEPGGQAERIYYRVGFSSIENQWGIHGLR